LEQAAIAFFLLAAAYELLHVDIEAAISLFHNNDAMEVCCATSFSRLV
jgi:hypothetical protein